ncbi:4396_t:CDS:2, partial [Paraglomus brasilianum]
FAHIEASRLHAWFCESNIAKLTIELAASFESMAKALSLYFKFDVPNDEELVRQMDQKIVSDTSSNTFKHTWAGGVTVRLFVMSSVGIPEEHLSNIFQRFYRVESQLSHRREGTGIGLALVKELVTRHDGEIHVTSQVNVGTTFRIWIPTIFLSNKFTLEAKEIFLNLMQNTKTKFIRVQACIAYAESIEGGGV